jgi:DNA (cytosine-5)-methyltransferase 1
MKYYFIDLFCGAGGVTTGVHRALIDGKSIAEVIACVNHDATAILSHEANHPDVLHYTEDIRTLDLTHLIALVQKTRVKDPDGIICLWASLECTNFSKAKGGLPRDADSRTLAEHLFRYIEGFDPDMIWIENVEEFMSWGPLDENGKPVSRRSGSDYMKWVNGVQNHGYDFDYQILNAADFGAYTSRKRYFAQFAKPGVDICWPQATHSKKPNDSVMFSNLKKWKPVREVLNLKETGESIFVPGRIKSDKTFERIYHGLIKFVAGGKKEFEAFMMKFNSTASDGSVKHSSASIDNPSPTIDTHGRIRIINPVFILQRKSGDPLSKLVSLDGPSRTITTTGGNQEVISTEFLMKYFSGKPEGKNISLDGPAGTVRCADGQAIVQAEFLMKYNGENPEHRNTSLDEPAGTIRTANCHYLISYHHGDRSVSVDAPMPTLTTKDKKAFISAYYGNGHNCTSIENPSPTVTGGDRFVLCSPQWIFRHFGSDTNQGVNQPSGSVSTNPKLNLITAEQFLLPTQFDNKAKSLDEPAPTQTANRKHFYLMNPQWFNTSGSSVEQPCFTIIARQDKSPAYLICAETGFCAIEIFEEDMPHAKLIKAFMALFGIYDIKMRMLEILELLKIQGFILPAGTLEDYILKGTKTKQKWMLGNACEVNNITAMILASFIRNREKRKLKAA